MNKIESPEIKEKHLSFLTKKDLLQLSSEKIFKVFFLLCKSKGIEIPYTLPKKEYGMITKIKKSFETSEDLYDFFNYIINHWIDIAFRCKISSTVPNIKSIFYNLESIYNDWKQNKNSISCREDLYKWTGKYAEKE